MSGAGWRTRSSAATAGLTAWQLVWLVVTALAIEDATVVDHYLAAVAGIDGWVAILAAAPLALVSVWAVTALVRRHPRLDLIGILRARLGWLVYLLGPAFVLLFLATATLSARTFVIVSQTLGEEEFVPAGAFLFVLIGTAVWGAWLGIEVVARINTAILWFVDVPLGVVLTILATNHESLVRLLPVLASGWGPIWSMVVFLVGKGGEFAVMLVYASNLEAPARLPRATVWGFAFLILMALGHTAGPAMTFGASVRDITWPSYSQIRAIEFGRFVENLSLTAVLFWIHGFWLETTLFLDATARTTARLLGLRSHRALIPVAGGLAFGLVYVFAHTDLQTLAERRELDTWGFMALGVALPLLLLALTALAGRGSGIRTVRWRRATSIR